MMHRDLSNTVPATYRPPVWRHPNTQFRLLLPDGTYWMGPSTTFTLKETYNFPIYPDEQWELIAVDPTALPAAASYVIQLEGKRLYWSNDHGWGDFAGATRFGPGDIGQLNLPMGGIWIQELQVQTQEPQASRPRLSASPTTPLFWDCDCMEDSLHLRDWETHCPLCMAKQEDSPDADLAEVKDYLIGLIELSRTVKHWASTHE
jgi:hypothetical protein